MYVTIEALKLPDFVYSAKCYVQTVVRDSSKIPFFILPFISKVFCPKE